MQAVLISATLAALCAPMLEISTDIGAARRFALGADAGFSVTYWHSMYDAPVTEDFIVGSEAELRLVTVRSDHGGTLEYLGFEGQPGTPQPVDRRFPSVSFLVATREAQTLRIGTQQWSFREFGAPGARLLFTPRQDCAATPVPSLDPKR